MTRDSLNNLRLLLLVLALSLGTSSCSSNSRFQVGYAEFWVEFYDRVVDWTGRVQTAYCGRYLVFTGDIDTACSAFPMVWSYAQNAWVECTYLDSFGQRWYYTDLFYFWPGYIQEPACFDGYDYPLAEPAPDFYQSSELPRDEDGQIILAEIPEVSPQRELSEDAVDLDAVRETIRQRLGLQDLPDELPVDAPGDPVRTGEPRLGEPPPELVDPALGRTSRSELPRDEQGRLLVEQELGASGEPSRIHALRELLRQRSDGEALPDALPDDALSGPIRRSEPILGTPAVEVDE